jgi:opacity protein-like surface antigen
MKEWIKAAVAGVMLAGASAASAQVTQEVYGQVGTEGVGIGYGHVLGSMLNARAEFNGFALSHNFSSGGLTYNGTLDLAHAGLYLDFFPLPSIVPFRLTAGVIIGGDSLNATAQPQSGSYTINGHTYSAQGQQITAKASYPTLRPYVGIGLGHSPIATRGWGLFFDAGIAYGQPQLDFSAPSGIVAEAGQANLNAEEQQLANTIDRYRFYPIVKIGATYRF